LGDFQVGVNFAISTQGKNRTIGLDRSEVEGNGGVVIGDRSLRDNNIRLVGEVGLQVFNGFRVSFY
jgi:hypothetical protein